jgi:alkylation response protein AidB-like acyl-CoA dehydrogenase
MIDLLPNEEQRDLVESVRNVIDASAVPANSSPEQMWGGLFQRACELDWAVLGLPESMGGAGFATTDEFLVFVELGRKLAPPQLLFMSLGTEVAAAGGDMGLAESIRSGDVRLGLAEPIGEKLRVLADERTDLVLFRSDEEWAFIEVPVASRLLASVDSTLGVATIEPEEASVTMRVADEGNRITTRAALLVVAFLVGISQATCDRSVSYAKTRMQFGRPIGANQVVKHRCADMAVRAAAALALGSHAAVLIESSQDSAMAKLTSARIIAVDAAIKNASADIRNHGGVGFTYENWAHWYLRRARLLKEILEPRELVS